MTEELVKTCENCKYDDEDMEGTHCRHCIHNATEHFEPKEVVLSEQEIRAKAIDEFFEELQEYEEDDMWLRLKMSSVYAIAEQLKAGNNNEK
jgi:hypothetical protein